jgi:hypothetical protein
VKAEVLVRVEALLKRAEEASGNYTNVGDQYYFDGYISDPTRLLELRHDIAETAEALGKAIPAKAQYQKGP